MLDWAMSEDPLSERERDLRDHFVSEYMKDFDVFKATIRVGFQPVFAIEWSKRLFQCPYVQRAIMQLTRKVSPLDDATAKAEYASNLRFLMYNGSEASRVAASKQYAEFMGWAKPDAGEDAAEKVAEALRNFAAVAPV